MKRLLSTVAAACASLAFTPVFGNELSDDKLDKVVGGTLSGGQLVLQKQQGFLSAQNQAAGGGNTQQAAWGVGIVQVGDDVNVLSNNKTAVQVGVLGNKQVAFTNHKSSPSRKY